MLIIIPSYKRLGCLPWVLESLARCHLVESAEPFRVVVANNYPPNKDAVTRICNAFGQRTGLHPEVVDRGISLPPAEHWYRTILETAALGETVILHGDDDLFLPWGVASRVSEIQRANADMLLSDFADKVYFFDSGRKYWLTEKLPSQDGQAQSVVHWGFHPEKHPDPSFLSNHCYRNTPAFRSGLELAFEWCESQTWIDRSLRTLMLPFYLPYAIAVTGGRVVALHSQCVLRGADADELVRAAYGVSNWNTAFCDLCAYDIFANRALRLHQPAMLAVCDRFLPNIRRSFATLLFDGPVLRSTAFRTIRHANLPLRVCVSLAGLYGLRLVVARLFGQTGRTLKKVRASSVLKFTEQFFEQ